MEQQKTPFIILVSGPNGAGKSTFCQQILSKNPLLSDTVFINFDEEIKNTKLMPKYSAQYEKISAQAAYEINMANKTAASTFKKQMEQICGNLNERITQPVENKTYWYEQYRVFIHVPTNFEHIITPELTSKVELAKKIGGKTIHDRINNKTAESNWYTTYKKLVHNLEVKKAIITNKAAQLKLELEHEINIKAARSLREKLNQCFYSKQNIVFETVCTKTRIASQAINFHYKIYRIHICVLHPEISITRVNHRVQTGGHDIPTPFIIQRYNDYFKMLPKILPTQPSAIVLDNSGKKPFTPIFMISNGFFASISQCPEYLQQAQKMIQEQLIEKKIHKLLHQKNAIDIKKLTDDQREIFIQSIITNMLTPYKPSMLDYASQFLRSINTKQK